MTRQTADPENDRREWLFNGFRDYYVPRYLRKHFHAVRLSKQSVAIPPPDAPIIVVLNHPSWWDPLVCVLLSKYFAGRTHFGAIDNKALQEYGFLKKIGVFGVESNSLHGASEFLRTSSQLLSRDDRALWITAQGRFADVRERPLGLRSGVGYLAARVPRGYVLPVAVEYAFWQQSTAEVLLQIGQPLVIHESAKQNGKVWTQQIEAVLTSTMDQLARTSILQDESLFDCLLGGTAGARGVYDSWRRLRSWLTGKRFNPEHMSTAANARTQQRP